MRMNLVGLVYWCLLLTDFMFLIMSKWLHLFVSMCTYEYRSPQRPEDIIQSPIRRVTRDYLPTDVREFWEMNLGPLQESWVLFTADPFLQLFTFAS